MPTGLVDPLGGDHEALVTGAEENLDEGYQGGGHLKVMEVRTLMAPCDDEVGNNCREDTECEHDYQWGRRENCLKINN